ncbi:MAG: MFS transporter [Candidatus Sungbacteria bacterium]|nr:MFS transporter [Candidatus Sungbacteria bacterium]
MRKFDPFLSLSIREYRLFLIGFFISQMGLQMQIIAVNWHIYQISHSAVILGLVGIVSFAPMLLLSTIGGLTADHVDRKKLLMATQAFLALVALSFAIVTAAGTDSIPVIFILLGLNFSAMAFFGPVRQSIIPDLVPKTHLLNAVSLNTLARQSAVIIGPAIAGFLIALYGVQSIYLFNSAGLIIVIVTIVFLKIPAHPHDKKSSFSIGSVMESLRFVKKSKLLLSATLLDFFASFFGSATSLLPIFAADILQVNAQGLGLLYAATSAGAVIAGISLASLKKLHHYGRVIIGAVIMYGLATIGFGLSHSFYLSLAFLAIAGAGDMISTILRNNIRQTITPANMRGRMTGIHILFAQGGPKLGDAEAGFVAAATSAPASVVIGGIGTVAATLAISFFTPRLRKFKGHELIPE